VPRLGGDEFAILLTTNQGTANTEIICEQLIDSFDVRILFQGATLKAGCSVGFAVFPNDGDSGQGCAAEGDGGTSQDLDELSAVHPALHRVADAEANRRTAPGARFPDLDMWLVSFRMAVTRGLLRRGGRRSFSRFLHVGHGLRGSDCNHLGADTDAGPDAHRYAGTRHQYADVRACFRAGGWIGALGISLINSNIGYFDAADQRGSPDAYCSDAYNSTKAQLTQR